MPIVCAVIRLVHWSLVDAFTPTSSVDLYTYQQSLVFVPKPVYTSCICDHNCITYMKST